MTYGGRIASGIGLRKKDTQTMAKPAAMNKIDPNEASFSTKPSGAESNLRGTVLTTRQKPTQRLAAAARSMAGLVDRAAAAVGSTRQAEAYAG